MVFKYLAAVRIRVTVKHRNRINLCILEYILKIEILNIYRGPWRDQRWDQVLLRRIKHLLSTGH
jgi:hypothetical protein